MLNLATRALLFLTGVATALAAGYFLAGGERTGVVLLGFLAVAALVTALVTAGGAGPDVAPAVAEDAPPPERRPLDAEPAPWGTAWSAVAAAAVALLATGAAVGIPVVLCGVGAVVVATAGWFARVWAEHPSWTRPVRERVSTRLLVPVGLPVAAFLLAAVIAVSVSRILLAIPQEAAVFVALIVAVVILVACAWVASRPRLGSSALVALSALAGMSMVGAGIAGALAGEREFHPHEGEQNEFRVSARNLQFSKDVLTVPARENIVLEFVNRDEGTFHNVAVYEGEGPDAKPVFNGEGFAGHGERRYELRTPAVGTYTFVCDFHPNMKGKFVTEAI